MADTFAEQIKILTKKAAETNDSGDAMRFSQAASNVLHVMNNLKSQPGDETPPQKV